MTPSKDAADVDRKGAGRFFAVDRRTWALACSLGVNAALAYLVLARGTGPDQRTTAWSNHSVMNHAGIARARTAKAISALEDDRLIIKGGTTTRPSYRIVPAHQIEGCEGYPLKPLSGSQEKMYEQILAGGSVTSPRELGLAESLVQQRWLQSPKAPGGLYRIKYDRSVAEAPDWIWLPNSIVDGVTDEKAPVRLLRESQSGSALGLLIALYHSHNLADDGGISWRKVRQSFTREEICRSGEFVVFGFQQSTEDVFRNQNLATAQPTLVSNDQFIEFSRDWQLLKRLGLVEFVPHLIEADTDEANVIHPYAIGAGLEEELAVARSAHQAALSLMSPHQVTRARELGLHLAPVLQHISQVQMVGVARLRYRPKTRMTGAWLARRDEWKAFIGHYDAIIAGQRRRAAS